MKRPVKTLYLLRHADAERDLSIADIDRPLSKKGISETKDLRKKIKEKDFHADLTLCSPAKRTKKTCDLFLETTQNVRYIDELYNPELNNLLNVIRKVEDKNRSTLIVSHNPTISLFANFLAASSGSMISFHTAALAKIELNINSWEEIQDDCGKLVWFL